MASNLHIPCLAHITLTRREIFEKAQRNRCTDYEY